MNLTPDMSKALERRLLDLKRRFVGTLPGRVAAIAETLRQCLDGLPENGAKLDREFHSLAGTAGTYGIFAIAAAATDGEDACTELGGNPIDEHDARYFWSLIEEMENAAQGALTADSDKDSGSAGSHATEPAGAPTA